MSLICDIGRERVKPNYISSQNWILEDLDLYRRTWIPMTDGLLAVVFAEYTAGRGASRWRR
jgi:hypothetical protein